MSTTTSPPEAEKRVPSAVSSWRSQPIFFDRSRPLTLLMMVEMGLLSGRSLQEPLPPNWPDGELLSAVTSSPVASAKTIHDVVALYEHRKVYELQWMLWKVASTFGFFSYQHPSTNEIIPIEAQLEEEDSNTARDKPQGSNDSVSPLGRSPKPYSSSSHPQSKKRGILPHRHLQKILSVGRSSDDSLSQIAVSPYVTRICANQHLNNAAPYKASTSKKHEGRPMAAAESVRSNTRNSCSAGELDALSAAPPGGKGRRRSDGAEACSCLSFSSSSSSSYSSRSDFSIESSSLTSAYVLDGRRTRQWRAGAVPGSVPTPQQRWTAFEKGVSASLSTTPAPHPMYSPLKLTLKAPTTILTSGPAAAGAATATTPATIHNKTPTTGGCSLNDVQKGYILTTPFSLSEMTPDRARVILNLPSYAQSHQMNLEAIERERTCYKDPVTGCLVLTSSFLEKFPNCGGELCRHCPHGIVCSRLNGAGVGHLDDESTDEEEDGADRSDEDWWNSSDSLSVASIFDELLEPVES